MSNEPTIAVTGLALRLPGATSPEEFWTLLTGGVDRTAPVSQHRRELAGAPAWDDIIGELEDIEGFDADFFGIEPEEARFMDPQHRILMEVAHDAVSEAGLLEGTRSESRRYAVYMGLATNAYYPLVCRYLAENGLDGFHPRSIMNNMNSGVAARISHQYNLTGPVMTVDTACSSFLSALAEAIEMIRGAGCDGAVVGGANILSSQFSSLQCQAAGITSASGRTRVFDADADGTLLGEGAVVVVLEREEIARARNRRILGRILAHSINNDGASLNIMAPNPRGQARVIRDCYASGVDHTRIGYIEAHGTGTRIGDPIEINALGQVYHPEDFDGRRVGIGSVKSNFGHLLAAAGGVGLAKLLLSLEHGRMVPSLHLETPNPLLRLDETPFEVVTSLRDWPRQEQLPRVGAITSLGLGGTNVHLVVAEGEGEETGVALPAPVLCLSAASEEACRERVTEVLARLAAGIDPHNLAMTLSRFRPTHDWRARITWEPGHPERAEATTAHPVATIRRLLHGAELAEDARYRLERIFAGPVVEGQEEPRRNELAVVTQEEPRANTWRWRPDLTDHELAAELFLLGCPINWEVLFPDGQGTLTHLNPYPFAHRAHWVPNPHEENQK